MSQPDRFCSGCGESIPDANHRFCMYCGAEIPSSQEPENQGPDEEPPAEVYADLADLAQLLQLRAIELARLGNVENLRRAQQLEFERRRQDLDEDEKPQAAGAPVPRP